MLSRTQMCCKLPDGLLCAAVYRTRAWAMGKGRAYVLTPGAFYNRIRSS